MSSSTNNTKYYTHQTYFLNKGLRKSYRSSVIVWLLFKVALINNKLALSRDFRNTAHEHQLEALWKNVNFWPPQPPSFIRVQIRRLLWNPSLHFGKQWCWDPNVFDSLRLAFCAPLSHDTVLKNHHENSKVLVTNGMRRGKGPTAGRQTWWEWRDQHRAILKRTTKRHSKLKPKQQKH